MPRFEGIVTQEHFPVCGGCSVRNMPRFEGIVTVHHRPHVHFYTVRNMPRFEGIVTRRRHRRRTRRHVRNMPRFEGIVTLSRRGIALGVLQSETCPVSRGFLWPSRPAFPANRHRLRDDVTEARECEPPAKRQTIFYLACPMPRFEGIVTPLPPCTAQGAVVRNMPRFEGIVTDSVRHSELRFSVRNMPRFEGIVT